MMRFPDVAHHLKFIALRQVGRMVGKGIGIVRIAKYIGIVKSNRRHRGNIGIILPTEKPL